MKLTINILFYSLQWLSWRYVAPEILKNHPHDESVDMWSVGIIVHTLLVGYPPFMESDQLTLFRKIRLGDYELFEEDWEGVSDGAKAFIKKLLVVDPTHRLSATECLSDEWICGLTDLNLSNTDLRSSLNLMQKSIDSISLIDQPENAPWKACPCFLPLSSIWRLLVK